MLDFTLIYEAWPLFLEGLTLTCLLTIMSCMLGTALGCGCAWGRLHGPRWLRSLLTVYVELFRNTPFIIQIFFLYFGMASLGLKLSAIPASVLALSINLGAYACEIIRAGMVATPKGQIEAAQSLALSPYYIFTRVTLAPALARVWPSLTGQLVIILLASSVCSQISAPEVSYSANFIAGKTFRNFEAFVAVTGFYLLLCTFLRYALLYIGPRFIFGRMKF